MDTIQYITPERCRVMGFVYSIQKNKSILKYIIKYLEKHALLRIILAITALWLFGGIGMWMVEKDSHAFEDLPRALWNLMIYLTSGFEGELPTTTGGKVIGVTVVILGVALVGLFTATIASMFVENILRREKGMESVKLKNHIVICGWNKKTEDIIRELHSSVIGKRKKPIVVIKRENETVVIDDTDPVFDDVYFVSGDPSNERALHRANIVDANTAIVIADRRNVEFSDAQSILIALAIESINPDIHTCVEVLNSENLKHFRHTLVDECISIDRLGELILAQAAMNHGVSDFYMELLTYQEDGNEVYQVPIPPGFIDRTFGEFARALSHHHIIAVGLIKDRKSKANPPPETSLCKTDVAIVIARKYPEIDTLMPDGCNGG